jgi:hypothetical protein
MQSPDLVNENIEKLSDLFPHCVDPNGNRSKWNSN